MKLPAAYVDDTDGCVIHLCRVLSATARGKRYWSLYDPERDAVRNSGTGESAAAFLKRYLSETARSVRLLQTYKGPMRASEWAMTISSARTEADSEDH